MPASAVKSMTDVVDDKLMSDIVHDLRSGRAAPSGLIPDQKPIPDEKSAKVRGSGWVEPNPMGSVPGAKYVDQIADHFAALDREQTIADAMDRIRKLKG